MAKIDELFQTLIDGGASDLHLSEGSPPKMRTHGAITPIRDYILERDNLGDMLKEIARGKW